jgi:hypothetical protein
MARPIVFLLASVVPLLAMSGCGPALSSYLITTAGADLEGARAAGADKYAIYEYTAATLYLHKAREEASFADFGPAIDYASRADELAKKGIEKAQREKMAPTPEAAPVSPVVAPIVAPTAPVTTSPPPRVIIKKVAPPADASAPAPAKPAAPAPAPSKP